MKYSQTKQYVLDHGILLPNGQIMLTEPLKAFKKVGTYSDYHDSTMERMKDIRSYAYKNIYMGSIGIANLIIPAGTVINVPSNDFKLRASNSICYSVVRTYDKKQVRMGVSRQNGSHPTALYVSALRDGVSVDHLLNYARQFKRSNESAIKSYLAKPHHFDMSTTQCASGIHLYVEASKALAH